MHYTLRIIHETPNTHTIDLTPMVSLYFYSIFVEYPIYCNFYAVLTTTYIPTLIFQVLNNVNHLVNSWEISSDRFLNSSLLFFTEFPAKVI